MAYLTDNVLFYGVVAEADPRFYVDLRSMVYSPADNPNEKIYRNLAAHGFPQDFQHFFVAHVEAGGTDVGGYTPSVNIDDEERFLGRTIIYTLDIDGAPIDQLSLIRPMVHELTNAVGMGDRDGTKDYLNDKSNVMMYNTHWLKNPPPDNSLIPWTAWNAGSQHGADHIRAIRRANLEDDESEIGARALQW